MESVIITPKIKKERMPRKESNKKYYDQNRDKY